MKQLRAHGGFRSDHGLSVTAARMARRTLSLGLMGLSLAAATTAVLLSARARDVRTVARLRARLEQETGGTAAHFRPEMVADLPEPARRYFHHAIAPGTPLARLARLEMTGEMRLSPRGAWLPLHARQVLAPPAGF